ncbi:MAG: hypothetical protein P4L40_01480 [Terracidiphilus sp.]|nr:hypothetical protein [Terracidiphilus sp.]
MCSLMCRVVNFFAGCAGTIPSVGIVTGLSNTWSCVNCTLDNEESATVCTLCSKPRPSSRRNPPVTKYIVSVKKIEEGEGAPPLPVAASAPATQQVRLCYVLLA